MQRYDLLSAGPEGDIFPLEKQRGQIGQCFYGQYGSCGSTEAVSLGAEVSFPLTN